MLRHTFCTLTPRLPIPPGKFGKRGFERIKLTIYVELALELCNIGMLAVVAAVFIKYFHKHCNQRIQLVFRNDIGFLVDIEQDAFRRNSNSAL